MAAAVLSVGPMPWPRLLYQVPEAALTSTEACLPQTQLHAIGAAVIATRGEGRLCRGDLVQSIHGIGIAANMGRDRTSARQ